MIAKIILPHSFNIDYACDLLVGVDYGAFQLAKEGIKMDVAIGDFDSVTESEYELIEKYAQEVIHLPKEKNETDSEAALIHVSAKGNYMIDVYADFGVRFDHLLNNFHLLSKFKFTLYDNFNKVYRLDTGKHRINNTHKYLSLFTLTEALIDLEGVKYPLKDCHFTLSDTYLTSNEISDKDAHLYIKEGSVVIVQSNDK